MDKVFQTRKMPCDKYNLISSRSCQPLIASATQSEVSTMASAIQCGNAHERRGHVLADFTRLSLAETKERVVKR